MEYPFKDLMPFDEVLEREGYYRDWTHLDPEVFYSLTQISEYIKTKGYGVDVRLLIAQLAEHFGFKTTQVVDLANLLQQKFENLEGVTQSFTNNINSLVAQMKADKNAVIANVTVDSEVILARGGKATLGARFDDVDAQLAHKVTFIDSIEDLLSVTNKTDSDIVSVSYYYKNNPQFLGGGIFEWSPNTPKNKHDGGMIIDPDHKAEIGHPNWYDYENEGLGCWVRKYETYINLQWYGVKNDMSADISKAFQNAIDFSFNETKTNEQHKAEGVLTKRIKIPIGNYLVEDSVYVNKRGLEIYGEGEGTTLLANPNVMSSKQFMLDVSIDVGGYFSVSNLSMVGDISTDRIRQIDYVPTVRALRLHKVSHSTKGLLSSFKNLSFYGFERAIEMGYCWLIDFENISFVGSTISNKTGEGIYLGASGSSDTTMPIGETTCNAISIRRSNFQNIAMGVVFNYGLTLSIKDSSFENCSRGVKIFNSTGVVLDTNYFEENTVYSVEVGTMTSSENYTDESVKRLSRSTSNVQIINSTHQGSGPFISLLGCQNLTVANNSQNGSKGAKTTADIEAHTVVVPSSEYDGKYYVLDSYIEYYRQYQLLNIPKEYTNSSLFVNKFTALDKNLNSMIPSIIDSGENGNGNYTRFADGTQVCRRTVSLDLSDSATQTFRWALPFKDGQASSNIQRFMDVRGNSSQRTEFRKTSGLMFVSSEYWAVQIGATNGAVGTIDLALQAIGRWK